MEKPLYKFLILAVLLVAAFGIFSFARTLPKGPDQASAASPIPLFIPVAPPAQTTDVLSPDGAKTLSMKEEKNGNSITYTFSVVMQADGSRNQIFTRDLSSGSSISIPYNTWAPDDRHLFLRQVGPDKTTYFVLSADGSPMSKDAQTFNITELFAKKITDYKITDVTGWAAPNLVVINTDKISGGQGLSFWFDITSQSFIPLSNRFN